MSWQQCGTRRGYKAHKDRNEPPCKWCLIAHEKAQQPQWRPPWFAYVPAPGKPGPKPFIGPKLKAVKPPRKRGRPRIEGRPECGTERAYHWEKRYLGETCPKCRAASAAAQKERYHRRQEAKREAGLLPVKPEKERLPNGATHGSQRGWQACRERPEGACADCIAAKEHTNKMVRERRAARKQKALELAA
ncbi:hypothetical protein ACMX2H_15950 [Arthrobacter sulfonylureivorans]|uniref:hypothetical protein n=1 Tax=Arthrobacter sulfonylureivorans TaxID=2486855 RepID=UPI0039E50C22